MVVVFGVEYEYRIENLEYPHSDALRKRLLDSFGKDGWLLVSLGDPVKTEREYDLRPCVFVRMKHG